LKRTGVGIVVDVWGVVHSVDDVAVTVVVSDELAADENADVVVSA
jgi:hypothetical protein